MCEYAETKNIIRTELRSIQILSCILTLQWKPTAMVNSKVTINN